MAYGTAAIAAGVRGAAVALARAAGLALVSVGTLTTAQAATVQGGISLYEADFELARFDPFLNLGRLDRVRIGGFVSVEDRQECNVCILPSGTYNDLWFTRFSFGSIRPFNKRLPATLTFAPVGRRTQATLSIYEYVTFSFDRRSHDLSGFYAGRFPDIPVAAYVSADNWSPDEEIFNDLNVTEFSGAVYYDYDLAEFNVPEPQSWAMMLMGFGLIGTGLRTRNRELVRA